MDRQTFLRKEIAEYKRRMVVYPLLIAEMERELGETVPAAGSAAEGGGTEKTVAPGTDPLSLIRPSEFYGMSQTEATKSFMERFGKPLTTDELIHGLEKGGLKLGGESLKKKKANFATILIRADGITRVGRGTWALGAKRAKSSDGDRKSDKESKTESKNDVE
jgi:hypothetical protein